MERALTLRGVERPMALEARADAGAWSAEVELSQPDFGFKPYTAMLGALKVKPAARVRLGVHGDEGSCLDKPCPARRA